MQQGPTSVCISGGPGSTVFRADETHDGWVCIGNLMSGLREWKSHGLVCNRGVCFVGGDMDGVQGNGINSVHNGLLMQSDLRNDFDNYLSSINPDQM